MKKLQPQEELTNIQLKRGLKLVVIDGLAAEAMSVFTEGTFLIAMALLMGATNAQIGLIAALPALSNVFQLISVWLVQRYNNRRAITVICSFVARFPLIVIGLLPFISSGTNNLPVLIGILSFHYFFGSISGASWNAWMKDLIPTRVLGSYYAHRIRITQSLNIVLSLALAFLLDYIKKHHPVNEATVYGIMFITGGIAGIIGVYLLAITPEPKGRIRQASLGNLFLTPLRNRNFRKLLAFHSLWVFAINIAAPFFTVFLLRALHLPLFFVISLTILGQITGIVALKMWGRLSDRFGNKALLMVCAPAYICCILSWVLFSFSSQSGIIIVLLILIHICSGAFFTGITLALTNIGYKIAPDNESIVYISLLNTITSIFAAIAPIAGGLVADYFSGHQLLAGIIPFTNTGLSKSRLQMLNWDFFFITAAVLAMVSLIILKRVKEQGERSHFLMLKEIKKDILEKARDVRMYHTAVLSRLRIRK